MTSKHQVTIPSGPFEDAKLEEGDVLAVRADGPGRIIMERPAAALDEFRGVFDGVFEQGYLDRLRDEWD